MATARSSEHVTDAAQAAPWDAHLGQPPASPVRAAAAQPGQHARPRAVTRAARRAREEASIARAIPLLVIMVVTIAGVYIAWDRGSAGGGSGGVVGGGALLTAALARLVLPERVAGLLAVRKRSTDVATLAIFGGALLASGLSTLLL
jgi:hypothetical protein